MDTLVFDTGLGAGGLSVVSSEDAIDEGKPVMVEA
jgi:hypothetical protein